jgi:molecular chaperone DnaJ
MATQKRDYYEVLGVAREATQDEIRRAFRKLAFEYHPDRNKAPDAADRFKEINEAYEVLQDEDKRRNYDQFGHAGLGAGFDSGFGGFAGFGFEDIFDTFFGRTGTGRRPRSQRGTDLRVDVDLTFEQSVFGTEKEIEIPKHEPCGTCSGSGLEPGTRPETCTSCGGSGELRRAHQSIFGQFVNVSVCGQCAGEGRIIKTPCKNCRGTGQVQVTRHIQVKIPAGIENGTQIRLTGEGEPPDQTRGGRVPGDLYVAINAPGQTTVKWDEYNLLMRRQGHDLVLDVPLNVAQAALGEEIAVPTLDGPADLKIPSGTQYGKVFRVKGKGVPHLRENRRGDLQVRVHVMVPTELSKEQRELFKKLEASFSKNQNSDAKGIFEKIKEAFGV